MVKNHQSWACKFQIHVLWEDLDLVIIRVKEEKESYFVKEAIEHLDLVVLPEAF